MTPGKWLQTQWIAWGKMISRNSHVRPPIVATLTLSYLMRRPSSSGEGVTALDPGASTLV